MAISKHHADVLRRHGPMWEVGNVSLQGHAMVRIKLLDNDDVVVTPSVAHQLGQAIINAAVETVIEGEE